MKAIKNNYAYVLKSIKKDRSLQPKIKSLDGLTYVVSGGTRGIGFNIAKNLALQGANIVLLGKTEVKHAKLEGTIYSAAEKISELTKSSNCIGIPCDVRSSAQIDNAMNETISYFGKIDGTILNASALCLNHFYYSMSKFNMSLMAKFWDKEFKNVGVNTLWPRTTIDTAPVRNILGGDDMVNISRRVGIMGEAAKHIIMADQEKCTGKNFIDDEVLASMDIDVEQYRVNETISEKELMPDFFC